MNNTYGVKIHGRSVTINGVEVPNVVSVHFSESSEQSPRTVVEVDGEFDFEGLSGVEFVFHPSSIREAVQALAFYAQTDDAFSDRCEESVMRTLHELRNTHMSDTVVAQNIVERLLEDLDD